MVFRSGSGIGDRPRRALGAAAALGAVCLILSLFLPLFSTPSRAAAAAAGGEAAGKIRIAFAGDSIVNNYWSGIERIIDGNPCLKNTVELGRFEILRSHLAKVQAANAKVKYIGTRDAGICSGKFLEPDGVHLTGKGYRYMWAMIDSGAGTSTTAVASAPPKPNDAQKSNDGNITTAALVPRPAPARVDHRLVMEIHVPGAPSEPLVWTRSQN